MSGTHDGPGELSPAVVDVIHRIVTDPGRLSRSWYEGDRAKAMDEGPYVELIGVVVSVTALDVFARGIGVAPAALPEAEPGAPSQECPETRPDGAWVPLVPLQEGQFMPYIGRALSSVPAEWRNLGQLAEPHYMALHHVPDPHYETPGRAIDRLQMELVASRVSKLNDCFY